MRKTVYLGVILAMLGVVAICGCVGGASKQQETYYGPQGESATVAMGATYDEIQDITPTNPIAQHANSVLKPILEEVFGGAKLMTVMAASQAPNSVGLEYIIPRNSTQEDCQTLSSIVQNRGYTTYNWSAQSQEGDSCTVSFIEGSYVYIVTVELDKDDILVSVQTEGMS